MGRQINKQSENNYAQDRRNKRLNPFGEVDSPDYKRRDDRQNGDTKLIVQFQWGHNFLNRLNCDQIHIIRTGTTLDFHHSLGSG